MLILFHLLSIWWRKIFIKKNYWDPKLYSIGGSFYCNGDLFFDPPCYLQRYGAVLAVIEEESAISSIKKVVDFGCAEASFFLSLKHLKTVVEILEVDIDKELLQNRSNKVEPLLTDFLYWRREIPLNVKVCCGSASEYDPLLKDTDVVVAIELIEHLYEDTLEKLPNNIFGCIRPKLAVFTTPNAEFNVFFKNFSGMRHWDHKFEWTRKEFEVWALSITKRFPEYSVKLFGIGPRPRGTQDVGCCSQMAVFRLQDPHIFTEALPPIISSYEIIREVSYPYYVDTTTREEKIVNAVRSEIWEVTKRHGSYSDVLPLKDFLIYIKESLTLDELREILQAANWTIKGTPEEPLLVVPRDYFPDSEESDDFDFDDHGVQAITDEEEKYSDDNEKVTWDYFQKNNCEEPIKEDDDIYSNWGNCRKSNIECKENYNDWGVTEFEDNSDAQNLVLNDKYNEWDIEQLEGSSDGNPEIMNCENQKIEFIDKRFDGEVKQVKINKDKFQGESSEKPYGLEAKNLQIMNLENDDNFDSNTVSNGDKHNNATDEFSEHCLSETFVSQLDVNDSSPTNRMSKSLIVESADRSESDVNGKRCKRKTDDKWTDIYDHKKKIVEINRAGPSKLIETDTKIDLNDDGSNDWWNGNNIDPNNGSWPDCGWDRDRIEPLRKKGGLNRIKKPLAKSCSLDSCLENINCERTEVQAMYLSMHSRARTHDISSPGPDSGYPASTSMDLTDGTSGFPASACLDFTSEDSLSGEEEAQVVHPRLAPQPPPPPVENGDVANNNRDGEGNNVEGMRNPLPPPFAPPAAFPPWLLQLLLDPPLQIQRDEGLGDEDSDASDSPVPSIN